MAPPVPPRGGRPRVNVHTATDGRDILVNTPDGWEVDQPWLWWSGPADGDGVTGGPLGNPPPGAGLGGRGVPAAVARCTSLIADTLAGLPWKVRRGREHLDAPDWIGDPQATRRDERIYAGPLPDTRRSAVEFRSAGIRSLLWKGEWIIFVPNRAVDGTPMPPVWQLNPDLVAEEDGVYSTGGTGATGGDPYEFAPGELVIVRGIVRDDYPRGVGVLQDHLLDLILAGVIRGFATNMFRPGVPNGYLKVNAPQLTRERAHELQAEWMRAHSGLRRKIAVLNATTDFQPIAPDAQALQLAQMRDYSTLDLALIFGVPPYMLGLRADNQTYANIESRLQELATFTLLPWSRRVESGFESEFPRGTTLKINMDGLVRADTITRYQAHRIGLDAGFLTIDEVRALEDLPPLAAAEDAAAAQAENARLRVVGPGAAQNMPQTAL